MRANKDYDVLVAKCGRAVGLSGAIKLTLYTDFIEIFTKNIELFCNGNVLTLNKFNVNRAIAKFKEINNIDDAKLIGSKLLYMNKEDTRKYCYVKPNEYFWFDIIGCSVFDDNILVGKVIDINRMGNTDYLIVKIDKSLFIKSNAKVDSFMIPYIDRYVLNTDVLTKKIKTVDTIDILENS